MAGRRHRVAYRKKNQNRLSMILVTFVVLAMIVAVAVKSVELKEKLAEKTATVESYDAEIAEEESRSESIEEFAKEVQTKGYIEDVAREKLGLVYEDEILFKEED